MLHISLRVVSSVQHQRQLIRQQITRAPPGKINSPISRHPVSPGQHQTQIDPPADHPRDPEPDQLADQSAIGVASAAPHAY
jgi:hypothetical protein